MTIIAFNFSLYTPFLGIVLDVCSVIAIIDPVIVRFIAPGIQSVLQIIQLLCHFESSGCFRVFSYSPRCFVMMIRPGSKAK